MRLYCVIWILLSFMVSPSALGFKSRKDHLELMSPELAFKTIIHRGSNVANNSEGAALAYWHALASLANGKNSDKALSELFNYNDGENGVTRALALCRGSSILPDLRRVGKQERPQCIIKDEAETPCYRESDWESIRNYISVIVAEIEKKKDNGHCEGFKDAYFKLLNGKPPF